MNDTNTDTVVTIPYRPGVPTFPVPRRLGQSGRIASLSGDAIRLLLFISYKLYRRKTREVMFSAWELTRELGINKQSIKSLRNELQDAGLIRFEFDVRSNRAVYRLAPESLPVPTA
jgi:hypothetical protein